MSIARLMQQAAAGVPTGGGGGITPWELTNAQFNGANYGFFSIATQEGNPTGLFFKPDGTAMYLSGANGNRIYQYSLSTAWDITSASYVQDRSLAAQGSSPSDVFFKPDGLKMYVVLLSNDSVNEYDLSTAWDVSTASFSQSFSVTTEELNPQGVFFKPDGLKMYITGSSGDEVNEYDLSSAWDISTSSYLQTFSVLTQENNPQGIAFKGDGTKMYIIGSGGDDINEYSLSSAWDISTASFVVTFSVSAQDSVPMAVFFKPDGLKLYIVGQLSDAVFSYTLSTAWSMTGASFDNPTTNYFSVKSREASPSGLFFKPDGAKMYITGSQTDRVVEFDLSSAWEIDTASYSQVFSVSTQDTSPADLFFSPNGLKMYILGGAGDDINEYDLSSAWDISTASYLQTFSVATQDTAPTGMFFKPDGTKMYMSGAGGVDINEYDLSTAWDVSTASYLQNFSISARTSGVSGVFFKPDGTKMYTSGGSGADVDEYNLSTAWDISTASYVQQFVAQGQVKSLTGLHFKEDGSQLYLIGSNVDAVWAYDL